MEDVAFLDIDTQVDFMEEGGKLYAKGAEAIKPNLARLVAFAREHRIPMISSVDAHSLGDPELQEYPPHCLAGTPGQAKVAETRTQAMAVVPSAQVRSLPDPRYAHVVLEKQRFSIFSNPMTERVLATTRADTFVVFGVVTEVCVKQAVLGLLERGYGAQVVEDAIWPLDRAAGEQALVEMVSEGAVRTTTETVLNALVGSSS